MTFYDLLQSENSFENCKKSFFIFSYFLCFFFNFLISPSISLNFLLFISLFFFLLIYIPHNLFSFFFVKNIRLSIYIMFINLASIARYVKLLSLEGNSLSMTQISSNVAFEFPVHRLAQSIPLLPPIH